jgi:hypothetical protein
VKSVVFWRLFRPIPGEDAKDSIFFQALKEHEPRAYEQLMALCGPDIRAVIRCWLTDGPLRRVVDSVDVWQSILVKFDPCVQNGQFQAQTLEQLWNFLRTLARNRFFREAGDIPNFREQFRFLSAYPEVGPFPESGLRE